MKRTRRTALRSWAREPPFRPFLAMRARLYSANVSALLKLIAPKGELVLNREDQIIRETLVTHGGEVVNTRVQSCSDARKRRG